MPHGNLDQKLHQDLFPTRLSNFVSGNQVTLLQYGEAYFPAIEAAFDRARYEIYLETYIFENDTTGRRIADALKRAALRGVNVYMLIDGYGSKGLPRSMPDSLGADGVKILIFRPGISPWTFRRMRLRRLHRKIAVVDREIAFVGGINIVRDRDKWRDSVMDEKAWDPHLRSTKVVTGYHIQASDGGHVEDFIIDDGNWAIRYLIVDTRNWWPGEKVLIAPQWIERVSWSESKVFINLSREAIKQSPQYTEALLLTRDYETRLHGHYRLQGYWVDESVPEEHPR